MLWLKVFIIVVVLSGVFAVWYILNRERRGPVHCMGCGKCDKTGVCILTGEPVGRRRTPPETAADSSKKS